MTRSDMMAIGAVIALLALLASIPFWPAEGLPRGSSDPGTSKPKGRALEQQIAALEARSGVGRHVVSIGDKVGTCSGSVLLPDGMLSGEGSRYVGIVRDGQLIDTFSDAHGSARLTDGKGSFVNVEWDAGGCRVVPDEVGP